jgi:site-specific DNA-methyltransferase (adenine-specific)
MVEPAFYNLDCVEGAQRYLADNSVDLIITDPPYGIEGDQLHRHYNRNESHVLDGYIEVPKTEYPQFSKDWIRQAERVLRPGGSLYIVSGYTNLIHILNALAETSLTAVNHLIWKYNFGVFTQKKYISSHYHILYYTKPGGKVTFNTYARFADMEKNEADNGSLNYQDREDVWMLNKEYKPNQIKNKNELPTQLLTKMLQYSSREGDLVCDFFLGSFSTAKVAQGLNRRVCGFEKSKIAFNFQMEQWGQFEPGWLLPTLRVVPPNFYVHQREPITEAERLAVKNRFEALRQAGLRKSVIVTQLCEEFGRGPWAINRMLR